LVLVSLAYTTAITLTWNDPMHFSKLIILLIGAVLSPLLAFAEKPAPTHADVSYGPHERNVFDIWLTPSVKPTPLIIYIHGGGFRAGNKNTITEESLDKFTDAGMSVAAIHYRLSGTGPYPIMMHDAARALQTIRSRAKEWNLDANKVACYGGSAGAGISLWLGFHEDMANPESSDPIARQSTRITAAATRNGQSTYDLRTYRKWFEAPELPNGEAHFPMFGVSDALEWDSDHIQNLMEDASPITHLTKDDIPVYMTYTRDNVPVDKNTPVGTWVHHVLLGIKLQHAMKDLGLECRISSPDYPETRYGSFENFLMSKLTSPDIRNSVSDNYAKAKRLSQSLLILDGHIDTPTAMWKNESLDVSLRNDKGELDYARTVDGGLNAPFMSIFTPVHVEGEEAFAHANDLIDIVEGLGQNHPKKFAVAYQSQDVRKHFKEGIVSLPMGMENGNPLAGKLENLDHFYDRGIRYITLCHFAHNDICDSSTDDDKPHGGLSAFGEQVVRKMNALGMMVDVSHVSDDTIEDVLKLSAAPVIASHSSCREFTKGFDRNLPDGLIKKIAAKGGVVMVSFGNMFLNEDSSTIFVRLAEERDAAGVEPDTEEWNAFHKHYFHHNPRSTGSLKDVADHIDHIVKLVGVDHVGFGSDFDGVGPNVPDGLEDVSRYPALLAELLDRGYSEEVLKKICGENALRVWQAVELAAKPD
jgi:membrane dipeptidase